jgi:hypothetical protein
MTCPWAIAKKGPCVQRMTVSVRLFRFLSIYCGKIILNFAIYQNGFYSRRVFDIQFILETFSNGGKPPVSIAIHKRGN